MLLVAPDAGLTLAAIDLGDHRRPTPRGGRPGGVLLRNLRERPAAGTGVAKESRLELDVRHSARSRCRHKVPRPPRKRLAVLDVVLQGSQRLRAHAHEHGLGQNLEGSTEYPALGSYSNRG
jgi:hypothetical protein